MPQDDLQDQPLGAVPSATTMETLNVAGPDGVAPPLGDMSAEEFRHYGRSVVDYIANYFEGVERFPVLAQVEPGALIASLPAEPTEAGEPMEEILADVDRLIVPALTHWSHPGFFAYFATSTSAPAFSEKCSRRPSTRRRCSGAWPRPRRSSKRSPSHGCVR
jgi:aromatic-L-amino-acid decarboxylase